MQDSQDGDDACVLQENKCGGMLSHHRLQNVQTLPHPGVEQGPPLDASRLLHLSTVLMALFPLIVSVGHAASRAGGWAVAAVHYTDISGFHVNQKRITTENLLQ